MADDPDFIPNRADQIMECWAKNGLIKYLQLITNHTINSYEIIISKMNWNS